MGGIRVYDEDVVFLSSGWVAGGKLAWFPHANIGVEGTVSFSSADVSLDEVGGDETDFTVDVTEVRVDGVYQMLFQAEQKFVPYFSAGVGQMVFDAGEESGVTDEPVTNLTYGGGMKIFFTPRIALTSRCARQRRADRQDVRERVGHPHAQHEDVPGQQPGVPGRSDDRLRRLAMKASGVRDTDFDGVPDKDDLCPNTPRGVIVDQTGCPIDSDGDGVPDGLDACPNTPAGATVDERGCPMDSDNDGVYDGIDRCPNTPAGTQVDETGCPIEEPEAPATCLERSVLVHE